MKNKGLAREGSDPLDHALAEIQSAQPRASEAGAGQHRKPNQRGTALLSLPASLGDMDLQVGRSAIRGVLLVGLVALLILGARWGWTELRATPARAEVSAAGAGADSEPSNSQEDEAGPDSSVATAGPTGASPPQVGDSQDEVTLLVHVSGQIRKPGVVELRAGDRVVDAVAAAGGFTKKADQMSVNLARPVIDGEQIWVGKPGEEAPQSAGPAQQPAAPGEPGASTGSSGEQPLVDLNSATQPELEELPGVGPVTAQKILAWRQEHGAFSATGELLEVKGIGERTLAELEPLVTVGGQR